MGQSAALYCRVSTADQTCARQERHLNAFAKKAGYKVVGVWKETGSGAKDDRETDFPKNYPIANENRVMPPSPDKSINLTAAGDESHPIKSAAVIDVVVKTDKGAAYGVVIAAPVSGDSDTQQRLLDKIEAYIEDFYSPAFASQFGLPTLEYCKISVGIHPASDPTIFELLEKCRGWVESRNIAFDVRTTIFDLSIN